jgi:hypothetical protein
MQTSNSAYGQGAPVRQNSQNKQRTDAGQAFGIPSSTGGQMNTILQQPKITTMNVRNKF